MVSSSARASSGPTRAEWSSVERRARRRRRRTSRAFARALVFESGERKEPNAFDLARPFPRTHLKLTSMALPSVSNEIMCDPLGDTATHCISVRFSDGNVAHDDSVRSTSVTRLPMLVNSFVRGSGEVVAATPIGEDGVQVTIRITVQVRNQDKPGCVVETISRLFFIREN